jgi:hypothetical protein
MTIWTAFIAGIVIGGFVGGLLVENSWLLKVANGQYVCKGSEEEK